MHVDAVIPARGGSKGIPRKNMLRLGGLTLVARAIITAKLASCDRVFVSTEDEEIAEEADRHGAIVIDRPAHLAGDEVLSDHVMHHAMAYATADIVAMVQCTAPLMRPHDIHGSIWRLVETGSDICVTCGESDALTFYSVSHPHPLGWNPELTPSRRQERAPFWEINGTCWTMWRDRFLERCRLYSRDIAIHQGTRRFELDTEADWAMAQALDAAGLIPDLSEIGIAL